MEMTVLTSSGTWGETGLPFIQRARSDRPEEPLMHLQAVQERLARVNGGSVRELIQILREARERQSFVYLVGNGGSSSTASHWANDLGKATKRSGLRPFKVMSLAENVSWFSALSNDEGYERSFSGQLENFASPGDVLICISASGNSKNIIRAVELAKTRGVITVGLLGFDGGRLRPMLDHCVCIESEKGEYELVEDIHMVICHSVTIALCINHADL
jgi:D-sedoheptulose 7-phosphate isomerase